MQARSPLSSAPTPAPATPAFSVETPRVGPSSSPAGVEVLGEGASAHAGVVALSASALGGGRASPPNPSPLPPRPLGAASSGASFCSLMMMGGGSRRGASASGSNSLSGAAAAASPADLRKSATDEDLLRAQVMWEIDRSEIEWGEERKLGTGTYGVVVYAKWRGTPVAVKKVNLAADSGGSGGAAGGGGGGGGGGEGGGAVTGTTAIEDLRHEIAVMSHMHHPRVVQFLGASTRAKPWLILFEYLPGGTLTSIVDRPEHASGVRPALATRWSLECAQGLRYLHEHKPRPVIHRDLKPSNLLVDASGTAKISDFGLAKMLDIVKRMDEKYVMTGETGSYRYMAPEVFRHEAYSEKVDIYSLACVMFFLFMGEPPLASLQPLMAARSAAVLGKRATLRPNIDRRIVTLIEQCWHGDAAQRPTAADACKALEGVLADMGDSTYVMRDTSSCCVLA